MDEIINEILNECLKPVKDVANEIVERKRLKNKLISIGNYLCKHEQNEKAFDLKIVFSEDNMEELADGLQEISAGMYADYIDNKLKQLFERIGIESDRVEFYIVSFKERSRLISWERETKNQFFEYIYHAVWDNLDNMGNLLPVSSKERNF